MSLRQGYSWRRGSYHSDPVHRCIVCPETDKPLEAEWRVISFCAAPVPRSC